MCWDKDKTISCVNLSLSLSLHSICLCLCLVDKDNLAGQNTILSLSLSTTHNAGFAYGIISRMFQINVYCETNADNYLSTRRIWFWKFFLILSKNRNFYIAWNVRSNLSLFRKPAGIEWCGQRAFIHSIDILWNSTKYWS